MTFEEKQSKLMKFGRSIAARSTSVTEGLEAAESSQERMLGWVEAARAKNEEERDMARAAVKKVARGEPLAPQEANAYEAIVLPQGRPVLNVVNGSYDRPLDPWTHLDDAEFRRIIESAIPSVGRVEVPDHPSLPYAGTGFVVGDNLLMTNRHVAEIFVIGLGIRELRFRSGLEHSGIDFRREAGSAASEFVRIRQVLMVHPYWDMALLRVDGLSKSRTPLTLEAIPAEDLRDQEVVVIGYPAEDPRNDYDLQQRIFGGKFRVKRLQPGTLTGSQRTSSFGHPVQAMTHNSSTLGGNSGSAVISVKTGRAVGLHFGGVYLETNYAVPAYELSRDSHVIGKGVKFSQEHLGDVPWKKFWDTAESQPKKQVSSDLMTSRHTPLQVPSGAVQITVPLTVTISLGTPVSHAGAAAQQPVTTSTSADADDARARARAAEALPYYDQDADETDRQTYYQDLDLSNPQFNELHDLIESTHSTRPSYKPVKWVYPWVDRQNNLRIRSLYSESGQSFTFEEMIAMDEAVERERQERIAATEAVGLEALEAIEAALPFNCEHVVPQSWFTKKEPMRGDLHHLFGCESGCNSFRGNRAYFVFSEEALRDDCGQSSDNKFEPGAGKGAAARATLYFLLRYPKKIRTANLPTARLDTLLAWHEEDPVSEWERHRNQAIFAIQENRNPFIDFPRLASQLDLRQGLKNSGGESFEKDETAGEVLRGGGRYD